MIGSPLGSEPLPVRVTVSPSLTVWSGPAFAVGKPSSFLIVPVKLFMLAVRNRAFLRLLRVSSTVSCRSVTVSPVTDTVIVPLVPPTGMVTVPAANAV